MPDPTDTTPPSFKEWWLGQVEATAPEISRKATEYGTNSLMEVGRLFARQGGQDHIEDEAAIQLGCHVYAYGKMQRVVDAMLKGRLPSQDTVHDLMVYAAMSLYAANTGTWPGPLDAD